MWCWLTFSSGATQHSCARPSCCGRRAISLVAHAEKVGEADSRHCDDVHGAIFIAADRRDTPDAAQLTDQGRHGGGLPHHENAAAGMLAEDAARQGAGIAAGYD